MQQLSGIDATFLATESSTLLGHVTGVLVLDPATAPVPLDVERLRAHIDTRTTGVLQLRRRIVEVPLGLDRPWWVDVEELDMEHHVKHVAVPAPGGREELAELAGHFHSIPLDRSRPLWEVWFAEGLADGTVAMMTKVHHAAIDGVAGVEILGTLVDLDPDGQMPAVPGGHRSDTALVTETPSAAWLLARAGVNLARSPLRFAEATRHVVRSLPALRPLVGARGPAATGRESLIDLVRQPGFAPPAVAFNGPVGPGRSFTFATIDLGLVKQIKTAAGVTVNDVVLAVVSGAMRRWLADHGGIPDRPLTAAVPVSTRAPDQAGAVGNHISMMLATLATHIDDPRQRLEAIAEGTRLAKSQHGALPATILTDLTQVVPPAVLGAATRVITTMGLAATTPLLNLVVSNVPGPPIELYLAGARICHHYPLSAIVDGAGLNVTVLSVDDHLDLGFVSDGELVADQWAMADASADALDELAAAILPAAASPAPTRTAKKPAAKKATKATTGTAPTTKAKTTAAKTTAARTVATKRPPATKAQAAEKASSRTRRP